MKLKKNIIASCMLCISSFLFGAEPCTVTLHNIAGPFYNVFQVKVNGKEVGAPVPIFPNKRVTLGKEFHLKPGDIFSLMCVSVYLAFSNEVKLKHKSNYFNIELINRETLLLKHFD